MGGAQRRTKARKAPSRREAAHKYSYHSLSSNTTAYCGALMAVWILLRRRSQPSGRHEGARSSGTEKLNNPVSRVMPRFPSWHHRGMLISVDTFYFALLGSPLKRLRIIQQLRHLCRRFESNVFFGGLPTLCGVDGKDSFFDIL